MLKIFHRSGLVVETQTEADVVRCAEIYAHHVLHGTASFEFDPPDLAEMGRRGAALVAERHRASVEVAKLEALLQEAIREQGERLSHRRATAVGTTLKRAALPRVGGEEKKTSRPGGVA